MFFSEEGEIVSFTLYRFGLRRVPSLLRGDLRSVPVVIVPVILSLRFSTANETLFLIRFTGLCHRLGSCAVSIDSVQAVLTLGVYRSLWLKPR